MFESINIPIDLIFFIVMFFPMYLIKELSSCNKIKFSNLVNFATWQCRYLIFKTYCSNTIHCLKSQRSTTSGYKDKGIKYQSLWQEHSFFDDLMWRYAGLLRCAEKSVVKNKIKLCIETLGIYQKSNQKIVLHITINRVNKNINDSKNIWLKPYSKDLSLFRKLI